MDRTVIDIRREEEKELSETLYYKLEKLSIINNPTSELKTMLSQDMFVKSNPKAFPHVMHYLFNILDSIEFNKRFYWPILSKSDENAFRTATVSYLNHLNEKYHLGWPEVKSFLVIMPGGMKFLKFLLEFVDFIIDEEIKKCEKAMLPHDLELQKELCTATFVKQMINKNKELCSKAVEYKETLELEKGKLIQNNDILIEMLQDISKATEVPLNELEDEVLLQSFAKSNVELFQKSIVNEVNAIEALEKSLNKMCTVIDDLHSVKDQFPCEKEPFVSSYNTIQAEFAELCIDDILLENEKIKLDNLFKAFNCILPEIVNLQSEVKQCLSEEALEYEEKNISQLVDDVDLLENDISKFERELEETKSGNKNNPKVNKTIRPLTSKLRTESLMSKFIHTPPIQLEGSEGGFSKTRLCLLDDQPERNDSFTFANENTLLIPRSIRKKNASIMPRNENKSKVMDPLTFLRIVTKSNRKPKRINPSNLSTLASKWAERELMMSSDNESLTKSTIGIPERKNSSISQSPTISVSENCFPSTKFSRTMQQQQRIITEKFIETTATMSPDTIIYQQKSRTTNSLFESVHDSFENFCKLNTSPSGRLEPLVRIDHKDLPQIFVNGNPAQYKSTTIQPPITKETEISFEIKRKPLRLIDVEKDNENNLNIANLCEEYDGKMNLDDSKEQISNVSDSVLHDIIL